MNVLFGLFGPLLALVHAARAEALALSLARHNLP